MIRTFVLNEPEQRINTALLAQFAGNDIFQARYIQERSDTEYNLTLKKSDIKYIEKLADIVYDNSNDMNEGEYLELMNYLKSLYPR